MVHERKLLGQTLIEMGVCTPEQVQRGLAHQKKRSIRIGEALLELGFAKEKDVIRALCRQWQLRFVDLEKLTPPESVAKSMAANIVSDYEVVPLKRQGDKLIVAVSDPLALPRLDNLRFVLNAEIEAVLATPTGIRRVMKELYGIGAGVETARTEADDEDEALGEGVTADDAPVVRLVHRILKEALQARASDVHVEPMAGRLRVRYRIDGRCREIQSPPKNLQGPVLSRLKLMAGMNIAERRVPQDGRIQMKLLGREIDLRVSALPAYHGESVVMRILDKEVGLVSLTELGFGHEDYQRFQRMIKRPSGIFLVTGPTGSGKTTTLYAALKELNQPDVKIITAEDPVEYHIPGINQCQVLRAIGLDFPRILRSMLRQAPNIILVGEIRDLETAEIAIQAALTGHLVFSTLHTNDAPSALTRLIDMGVKPFLVSTAIAAVMAQRLVRRLCPECREPYDPEASELRSIRLERDMIADHTIYRARGCEACAGEGYRGRTGVFELFEMDSAIRELAFKGAPTIAIRNQAIASGGMVTLQRDGIRKILAGLTTIEEILAVTHSGDIAATA
jgi:type IV pilus assembly protein PilB